MSTELTKSRVHLKHDLAAFLQQLPKWQDLASRQLFVQWALLNHPHAGVYQLMGQNPAADAQALVLATLGPGATDAGLDAARQLLQQVLAEPVGKATKAEAKRLLKEAGRIRFFDQIPPEPLGAQLPGHQRGVKMSTETTRTRDHLKLETMALYECIVLRDMDRAQDHAETIINLVVHLKALEKRNAPRV